ncbi:succinate dehydrogenase, hydrophobic membrane anchor protein [Croceicoccus naphthovorans]|uniref:Succinate dehydrogenase hydrophobic membrane anchor subunit n=1 Tax=Croceicoccus naphthovorans TaxID=1348774 RepID=A0A0G3XH00_9SPHN|nr:succinate dehydrogenase, hydrophobic membrane anchor protein [Croceicoccus naphthovorans]AKM10477.1 succinate dehydrogenase [Croceicoccus naphthovorans]MBB3988651.1 succinate dehydrogenase / fumarate reductase membrane anchor subunit [Croceicoccus naphthovorans]
MGNGTHIGQVRGLGSAKHGAHHWLVQRFTAIGNLVLVLWFVFSLATLPDYSFSTVHAWLSGPIAATAMVLLIVSTFWHARLGMQVMIEDYVHGANRFAAIVLLNLIFFAAGVFGVVSVIRIALGA